MLTFGSPLFLWGLLGLAAPVLIHLIQRDLFRPVRFPSIRFIRRGSMPVERKKRLRDLPLLLLRMLLYAVIVTALARPEWQPEAVATEMETEELVLFVDVSGSMSGWNGWEEAREKALSRLDEAAGQPVALVASSNRVIRSIPLTLDHAEIRRTLEELEPEPVAGAHRAALREAGAMFSTPGAGRLIVFSDFQVSAWSPGNLPDLSPASRIEWVKTGRERNANVAIVSARALPSAEGRRQVIAELRNFGESEETRTLELVTGNQLIAQSEVTLAPGEQRNESFRVDEDTAAQAELRIEPDALSLDDTYHLWLGEPPPVRVLLVAPLDDEPQKAREVFFLQRALTARTEMEWLSFTPELTAPANLTPGAIGSATAVVLLGAAPYIDNNHWEALHDFVGNGGLLLVTPGNAPGRQFARLREQGFVDLNVAGTVEPDRNRRLPYSVDWIEPESALATLFQDEAAKSLYDVHLYRYLRLEKHEDQVTALLRSDNDDPLLFEKPLNRGRLLISAFAFDPEWTDFPITGAFLPMIRELASSHIPPDHGIYEMDTGASPAQISSIPGELPDGFDALTPGIYISGETPIVLNAPRSESTVETTDTIDLDAAAAPGSGPAVAGMAGGDPARTDLWPWFAFAALLFFLLEMPVAAMLRRRAVARGAGQEAPASPPYSTSEPVETVR